MLTLARLGCWPNPVSWDTSGCLRMYRYRIRISGWQCAAQPIEQRGKYSKEQHRCSTVTEWGRMFILYNRLSAGPRKIVNTSSRIQSSILEQDSLLFLSRTAPGGLILQSSTPLQIDNARFACHIDTFAKYSNSRICCER